MQKEIKEIADGSVQELLMKLLWAESVVVEKKCRSQNTTDKLPSSRQFVKRNTDTVKKQDEKVKINAKDSTQKKSGTGRSSVFQGKSSMQHLKCYKCKEKGHMAKDCPEVTK